MLARRPAARSRRLAVPPGGWSKRSTLSLASVDSSLSVLAAGSILSFASAGSMLSIGSTGSILSVGSAGSILSVGSCGSVLSVGSFLSIGAVRGSMQGPGGRRRDDDGADVQPLPPVRALGTALGAMALLAAVLDR